MEGDGWCGGVSVLHFPAGISKAFLPADVDSLSLSSAAASVKQQLIMPSPSGKRTDSFQKSQP